MRSFIVLIGLAMLTLACTQGDGHQAGNNILKNISPAAIPPSPLSEKIPNDLLITLERTQCYGTCPSYLLTIKADGSVTFEGREFVKHKGIAKSQITEEKLRALLVAFEKVKFFSFRDRYLSVDDGCQSVETDNLTATTSILIDGKSKKVQHYHGCYLPKVSEELRKIEDTIDETVNSKQWINDTGRQF